MQSQTWRWTTGIIYIIAVALIWIAASFVVQSVVDGGVSPFLITYICNSLFVIYIPIVEIGRCLESTAWNFWSHCAKKRGKTIQLKIRSSENTNLLQAGVLNQVDDTCSYKSCSTMKVQPTIVESEGICNSEDEMVEAEPLVRATSTSSNENINMDPPIVKHVDNQGRLTRTETAKISLLICPFWFMAQLTFNVSLKYTTVTSNTILSSTSSLFTFLVSLAILNEKFTWVKLSSVLLCMVGTIIVGLGDSKTGKNEIANQPLLGDFLCLVSAIFYALYTTLIRKKIPDEEKGEGRFSTAQFLGFLGLFNAIIFLPPTLILHFANVEPFHRLTLMQFGLIIGKVHQRGNMFASTRSNLSDLYIKFVINSSSESVDVEALSLEQKIEDRNRGISAIRACKSTMEEALPLEEQLLKLGFREQQVLPTENRDAPVKTIAPKGITEHHVVSTYRLANSINERNTGTYGVNGVQTSKG
ncbi:hypothetical protein KI387_034993 [Taxus chinensis]|uniref:EamA domain-containing protein n=1 Tax=Taxus chinensis TaxID=29808 RepID=A0AA38F6U5_TAXCH|nr:hypothetical protein KI387_034993 [Taxus chinensis]